MLNQSLLSISRVLLNGTVAIVGLMTIATSHAADKAPTPSSVAASGVIANKGTTTVPPTKVAPINKSTGTGLNNAGGNNQYPGTAPVPLPKPHKEAAEAATVQQQTVDVKAKATAAP